MGVRSPRAPTRDTFAAHRRRASPNSRRRSRSSPASAAPLLALGDQLCLDWVSRPEAFARLWPKLRRGYLLDALERLDGSPTHEARIAGFLDAVDGTPVAEGPSAALGVDIRLRGTRVIGSGLRVDGETVQLSAFSSEDGGERAFGRIARPSRRR